MKQSHNGEIARRLLLAKDFFVRGSEYSVRAAPIDRISAIHHLHISIEITAKAVLTHYEIRADRELNIDFETMLSQISRHHVFQETGQRLQYRQDLRNLNQARNLAQHHAHPPEYESLEHWRKICHRFLESAFETFFNIDFWTLNRITYVHDDVLRRLLEITNSKVKNGIIANAVYPMSVAFNLAGYCLVKLAPAEGFTSAFFLESQFSGFEHAKEISESIRHIYKRIGITDRYIGMVGSGIALKDLKRLAFCVPHVDFSLSGKPLFGNAPTRAQDQDEVRWALTFVTDCILLWQEQGLAPMAELEKFPDIYDFLSAESCADAP